MRFALETCSESIVSGILCYFDVASLDFHLELCSAVMYFIMLYSRESDEDLDNYSRMYCTLGKKKDNFVKFYMERSILNDVLILLNVNIRVS